MRYVARHRVRIKTFGDFDIFVDDKPLQFNYAKTKELLAVLVDSNGAMVTNGKIKALLWENDDGVSEHNSYLRNLLADLKSVLEQNNCQDIIIRRRGEVGLDKTQVDCDYYDWMDHVPYAMDSFMGEYMSQYSWGELTLGTMTFGR